MPDPYLSFLKEYNLFNFLLLLFLKEWAYLDEAVIKGKKNFN